MQDIYEYTFNFPTITNYSIIVVSKGECSIARCRVNLIMRAIYDREATFIQHFNVYSIPIR